MRTLSCRAVLGLAGPMHVDQAWDPSGLSTLVVWSHRIFGAFGWGALGDGHISARDPERTDAFWPIRYGVPFGQATVDDLVLVGPGGAVVEGEGDINMTAYYIHGPIHDARPEVVAAAHTHTQYGTPFAATATTFDLICQEATAFFGNHTLFDDEEVQILSTDGGKRIAVALVKRRGQSCATTVYSRSARPSMKRSAGSS